MNKEDTLMMYLLIGSVLMLVQGCTSITSSSSSLAAPQPLGKLGEGEHTFIVDESLSQVLIEVGKAGTQPQLGHVHLMRVHQLTGSLYLHSSIEKSRLYMQFPVAAIEVDNDQLRAQAGEKYEKTVREKDKLATYQNMLSDRVLNADIFPVITIESVDIAGSDRQYDVLLKVQVLDHTSLVKAPLLLTLTENRVCAKGRFSVNQTHLGITPLSVFMGAIKVADELVIHVDVCTLKSYL